MTETIPSDIEFLLEENERKPTRRPTPKVSDWVQGRRILPPESPFPGLWDNAKTPYLVEIMDNMSPASPIQHQSILKGAQVGATAAAENVTAYWMGECPADILFMSATDTLLKRWAESRLEPLIDSCDIRDKMVGRVGSDKSRTTGDKAMSKKFLGGHLHMASARSSSEQRAVPKRILIRDEIDGAPEMLTTGEGNWLKVSEARTASFEHRKKIMDFSTPTTMEASAIWKQFKKGDQRHFMMPCPHCGKFQFLDWGSERASHGMRADREAGQLKVAYYICDFCHEAFFNHHKSKMLSAGRWEPTAMSFKKEFRSYWLPSLYAAPGMISWTTIMHEWDEAQLEPDGMRSFVTLYLGRPFKETGSRPKLDKVIELRGDYRSDSVQDGTLFLTAGIDVQRGSEDDPTKPPRLEMEVCGHGRGFRTWSVCYKIFTGAIGDPYEGAWEKLTQFAADGGFLFQRNDGRQFPVMLILVDSGDGVYTDIIYRFASGWDNTFASKGFGTIKKRKGEEGDQLTRDNFKRYRIAKIGEDILLVEIATNYYKRHLYNNLKIERKSERKLQRPGFCDFPGDYSEKYFKQLTAAEMMRDGSFNSGRRADEALDCRVMNQCAGDMFIDQVVSERRAVAKNMGLGPDEIQMINHKTVLEKMELETARRIG